MTKFSQKLGFISLLTLLLVFGLSSFAFAQELKYPTVPGAPTPGPTTTLPEYVKYIFNLAMSLGGILALAVLVLGGFFYLTSAGSPEMIGKAKSWLFAGVAGLLLLFCSYLILTTINPQLAILGLPELKTPEGPVVPAYIPPEPETKYYQEIPIGLLIENSLAKNISCFDEDENLIDCHSKEILQDAVTPPISAGTHFDYCYQYDSDGDKEALLENHDRFDCVKRLSEAIKIKSEKLEKLVEELKDLSEELKDLSEELKDLSEDLRDNSLSLKNFALNCACSKCSVPAAKCNVCPPCSCSGDPCPDRGDMNNLRNNVLPSIIASVNNKIPQIRQKEKEVNEKRDEIRAFIYGADSSVDLYYYEPLMDTGVTPTFLPFDEALSRFRGMTDETIQDKDYLEEAENLTKDPYGQRISLAEFQDKKSKETIDGKLFHNLSINKYCLVFNCVSETDGICDEYGLNAEGKLCNTPSLPEGEPATFYFPAAEFK